MCFLLPLTYYWGDNFNLPEKNGSPRKLSIATIGAIQHVEQKPLHTICHLRCGWIRIDVGGHMRGTSHVLPTTRADRRGRFSRGRTTGGRHHIPSTTSELAAGLMASGVVPPGSASCR